MLAGTPKTTDMCCAHVGRTVSDLNPKLRAGASVGVEATPVPDPCSAPMEMDLYGEPYLCRAIYHHLIHTLPRRRSDRKDRVKRAVRGRRSHLTG